MSITSYFALVPAAGGGARMGTSIPKQYLTLAGRPLIYHPLATLCSVERIERVYVVLAPDDEDWPEEEFVDLASKLRVLRCGGATRAESVANGLREMAAIVTDEDWVLVHDAARACLTVDHVETLIRVVGADIVGGILATPVADTLKHEALARINATVPRDDLWQAQTPQMFRYRLLVRALAAAPSVTDESGAIEALGLKPKLVAADSTNFKVTYPLDLKLAEWILANR
ncbi:MAG: 2-C-methyl-D-erythritol 4-phosphate cytidylyltransferase [Gammaproteobacteria bacterium]|nr:2-C-methyl-D-erythritol 4-phosphate cytidylyltransferase [Gammaproteobacteria bacterium]MBU1414368.1 2-C-methyl-D-erythritol 4-phosphate cytidylyltransferase [Gammaproteobacteria bacterium]